MPTHLEILALIRGIAEGDEKAVQEFGDIYLVRFESRARYAGVPAKDCQDVAQEIYWAAVSQIQQGRLQIEAAFGGWLDTIIRRRIADHFRDHKHDKELSPLPVPPANMQTRPFNEELAARTADPAVVMEVHEALGKMPADFRVILHLKHYQGFTLKEISKGLGKPMSAVYRRLCEAEEQFRRLVLGVDEAKTQDEADPNPPAEGNQNE